MTRLASNLHLLSNFCADVWTHMPRGLLAKGFGDDAWPRGMTFKCMEEKSDRQV